MTKFYQPLDLTVNGFAKHVMARNLNDWYTELVSAQLDKGVNIDKIDIKLRFSLKKPLHAVWLVDFYSQMTSGEEKKVIDSGWISSGIKDAIALGLDSMLSIDPFHDISSMIANPSGSTPLPNHAICDLTPEVNLIGYSRHVVESSDEEDEVWDPSDGRNIFDVLDEFDDEQ